MQRVIHVETDHAWSKFRSCSSLKTYIFQKQKKPNKSIFVQQLKAAFFYIKIRHKTCNIRPLPDQTNMLSSLTFINLPIYITYTKGHYFNLPYNHGLRSGPGIKDTSSSHLVLIILTLALLYIALCTYISQRRSIQVLALQYNVLGRGSLGTQILP